MSTQNFGTKDQNFRSASEKWELTDSLMGGTDSMRAASTKYLPKYSQENDELYAMRVSTSTLYNAYKKALETNVGRITARAIQVEGGSQQLQDFVGNVDSTGRSLNEFAKDVLRGSINHGVSYILVDFPQELNNITLADINTVRPYFIDIDATQVMSVKSERIRGVEDLVYFKYSVIAQTTFNGWDDDSSSTVKQIREYQKVDGVVSFRVKELSGEDYVTVEEGVMAGLDFIPVVPVYGNRTDYMLGEPLFNDLAELNVRHWQSSSDQQWVLHYARSPILFIKGVDSRDENGVKQDVNVGPNSTLTTDRTDADMKYVEHGGAAIAAGRQDLQDIEDQMTVMGLDAAIDKTGGMTATGRAINAAGSNSILQSVALQLEDSLTTALLIVEMFYNSTTPFTVDVNKEYIPMFDQKEMTDVWGMYREGMITAGDLLKEGKRRNLLTPQFVVSDEMDNKEFNKTNEEE